jgi:hypothetical protein
MSLFIPKNPPVILLLALLFVHSGSVLAKKAAKNKPIIATIVNYECGDNCYLTVIDTKGVERAGLCAAPLCDQWNAEATMPDSFKGKKIRFVIGTGQQFDGGGNLMGTTDAFMQIEILN